MNTQENIGAPRGRIGDRMVRRGFITKEQLETALQYQKDHNILLGQALVELKFTTQESLVSFLNSDESSTIGEKMLAMNYITRDQLYEILDYQKVHGGRFGQIGISRGFFTEEQLNDVLTSKPKTKPRLGDELVRRGIISQEDLDRALEIQKRSGGRLGDILSYLDVISENDLYRALADQQEMGRAGSEISLTDAASLPYELALKYHAIVLREEENYIIISVQEKLSTEAISELKASLGKPVEQVIASPSEHFNFWEQVYKKKETEESVFGLYEDHPENSAIVTFTTPQIIFMGVILIILIICFIANAHQTSLVLVFLFQTMYLLMAVAKFYIVMTGVSHNAQLQYSPEQVAAIDEKELPVYTILMPVYKEAEVIQYLIERINQMDYPKYKLDVRILLEEDDVETIEVINKMHLPSHFTPVIVPYSLPKTKPKACNYGMIGSRGDYIVIYDAEDRPEHDQLKKAYLAFQDLPDEYVCVQAKLNYFNSQQNWLTKLFTQEYSMWFELLLVGIMQVRIPIPLGGTSNHFKVSFLKKVGGWDPFNVTEDADLGVRLYKYRYKTAVLDSRTWEEANSLLSNWIRQRSRWIKGYMQTFLVHMRNPIKLAEELGLRGVIGYIAMIFGTPFLPLINPLFWILMIVWIVMKAWWVQELFPGPLFYVASTQLVIGNFIFIYMNMCGSYYVVRDCALKKEEQPFSYSLIRYGLLTPLYWVFMSIAAYKALFQLFAKPFYWEKTQHGLTSVKKEREVSS